MRLGINALGLFPGKVGGAEQYLRNIVAELGRYEDITTYLFLNEEALASFEANDRLKTVKINMLHDHEVQLNGYIALYKIDVWFCPMFHLIPAKCSIPNVTTIFDIQQDYYPENFDPQVLADRKRLTAATVKTTDLVLTISEFSKQTLMEKYNMPEDKIKVTYLDADASFDLPIDPEKLEKMRGRLPKEFILFPANMWPHKNHAALIKGFAMARDKYNTKLKLVFTGARERETKQIEKIIAEYGLREHIIYLGYLPQDDMRYVFRCATMLAFPSLFEGFGIPLVEAMASDLPVICSTSSCIPEITGDAAVLFDGHSPEEICEAIHNVQMDKELRLSLVEKGRARRKAFSWTECAKETVTYLKSMYKPQKALPVKLSKHPKVTVVTPSYNQGEYIRDTIESVLNQTYDNIEYIVMDGGSTDNTVDILKSYGDRIKWVSEKDGGQADAVNKGIRVAEGEIIGWLNSDDTYYPEAIEMAVETLLEHPDCVMVYGEGDYIGREGEVTGRYNTKMFSYEQLAEECFICQPTAFFTREAVVNAGLLNADLQLCMDYELWMRLSKQGKVLYRPETLATSRMYEENKTMSRRDEVYFECCREVKRHFGYVPHDWLMGYARLNMEKQPWIPERVHYLALFLRYNFSNPTYMLKRLKAAWERHKNRSNERQIKYLPLPHNGLYPDGWIVHEHIRRLTCKAGANEVVIEGTHYLAFDKPLGLTVTIAGESITFEVNPGPFTLRMPIAPVEQGEHELIITADRSGCPAEMQGSEDYRLLSVHIASITMKEEELPLVSIVTPSFNQGKYIRNTIESVLGQNYPRLEYIVIDGGSTDETLSILKEYGDRLTWVSEKDKGQSDAINKGFRRAKGEIVAWLNSDDVYEPGAVMKAVNALRKAPQAGLVYGDGHLIDGEGNTKEAFKWTRDFNLWALTNVWDYIMQPATFFRAEALKAVGYLREDLQWTMDWDLWLRLAAQYDVVYIPEFLANSREYESTKTATGGERRLAEILKVMQQYSGEKEPYGYKTYELFERLTSQDLQPERKAEITAKLNQLIFMQPTPDKEGRCTGEANLLIRPGKQCSALLLEIDMARQVKAIFTVNGKKIKEGYFAAGESRIKLPPVQGKGYTHIRAKFVSEDLQDLNNQADSWIRLKLVD